jgi:uncharacterized membrane protein
LPECPALVALGLPLPSGAEECVGWGISDDAGTVAGSCDIRTADYAVTSGLVPTAARWTSTRGAELYSAAGASRAAAASADGSVVVGGDTQGPFVWTLDDVVHLGEGLGRAVSVSADGRVVVGGESLAWVWTAEAGVRELPPATAGRQTGARQVSADGSRIIGYELESESRRLPLIWSSDGQLQALPQPLPPDSRVDLVGLDANGSQLVANYLGSNPSLTNEAWLWTAEASIRLGGAGIVAGSLSADGRVAVATGPYSAVWRLDQNNTFEPVLPFTNAVHVLDFNALGVSGDGRVLAGNAALVDPLDYRRRAFTAWLP